MDEEAYTLAHLESAKADLSHLQERDSMDTSGNPDKFHTRIRQARERVDEIEAALKKSGVIPYSEQEALDARIDEQFPKAQSKDIVEYQGSSYQLRFTPKAKSRSGKSIRSWYRHWQKISE
jgi:hypothetical protein